MPFLFSALGSEVASSGKRHTFRSVKFKSLILLVVVAALSAGSVSAGAQAISRVPVIKTIAGNGTNGYSGDGGPATSAEFSNLCGLTFDNDGNLFIADPGNNRIRKLATGTGLITTFAGNGTAGYAGDNGPATNAELQAPCGEAIDSAGNLFIADSGNNVIRKVTPAGVITTVAGNNTTGYSGDNGLATSASLYTPTAVLVDSSGNLFIADSRNNRVREVAAATGVITTIAGTGTSGYTGDNGSATNATLNLPQSVVEDSIGNLYIADTGNNVVREVSTAGTITTMAGNGTAGYSGDAGPAASASLNQPYAIVFDGSGNLYIADAANNLIRVVSRAGIIDSVAGNNTAGFSGDGGPALSASLNNPHGIVLDDQGNIYISDRNNYRIREVDAPTGSSLFPATALGATSTAVTISLQVINEGTTITGITVPVSQGNKQEYTVTSPGCAFDTALAANTICNVAVTFTPAYPGTRPAPLQVASSAGQFNFGLSGIGTAPQASLSPGTINTFTTLHLDFPSGGNTGGVAVDSAGNVYAAMDAADGDVQTQVIFEFAAGTGTQIGSSTTFAFATALGLALDSAGNSYAAIGDYASVFKISPNGQTTTAAGETINLNDFNDGSGVGASGYSGDNGPAIDAELNNPSGVAVDTADNL
jgi:trimeric autotransporter adhesin